MVSGQIEQHPVGRECASFGRWPIFVAADPEGADHLWEATLALTVLPLRLSEHSETGVQRDLEAAHHELGV